MTNVLTFNERRLAYQNQPKLLIEELEFIFTPVMNETFQARHIPAYEKIVDLCPDRDLLLRCVADAVLKAAKQYQDMKGQ